jgi:hypothetical protein
MKRSALFFLLLMLVAASIFIFQKNQADPPMPPDQTNLTARRPHRPEPAFWDSAVVPDPGEPVPIITIRPEDLGVRVPTTPVTPQALIAKAISESNLPAIQAAALSWFQQDPTAARDWLAAQSTLEDLQPAISYIASSISEKGDLKTAIEWAKLLPEGTLREDTLFNMQALALRNRQITFSEINPEGISPDQLQELQNGAAGD